MGNIQYPMFNNEYPNKNQSLFHFGFWILSIQYWLFLIKTQNIQYPMFNNEYPNKNQSLFHFGFWILISYKNSEYPISNVQ